jgi:hypothetical protein
MFALAYMGRKDGAQPRVAPHKRNLFGMFFLNSHKNVILSGAPHGFIA